MRFSTIVIPFAVSSLVAASLAVPAGANPGGEPLWKFFADFDVTLVLPVADLSGNGGQDLVVGAADDSLYLVEGRGPNAGKQLWAVPFKATLNSAAAIPDVNGDGHADIIAGDQFGLMQCISGATGQVLWKYLTFGTVLGSLAVPDANADGVPDAVFASEDDTVYCMSGKPGSLLGKVLWQFGVPALKTHPGPPIAKIAVGGRPVTTPQGANDAALIKHGTETFGIAVGTSSDTVYCLSLAAGTPKWKSGLPGDIWKVVAFPDQNGDGVDEVLAACGADMGYLLDGATGNIIWSHAVTAGATSVAVTSDMDGDGKPDALIGDGAGQVHCVPGIAKGADVKAAWTYNFGDTSTILSIASMGDLDSDGKSECAVGTSNDEAALLTDKGVKGWSVNLGGTVASIGNFGDADSNGVADVVAATEMGYAAVLSGGGPITVGLRGFAPAQWGPNRYALTWHGNAPGNSTWRFILPYPAQVSLEIFDSQGRDRTIVYQGLAKAGENRITAPSLTKHACYGCFAGLRIGNKMATQIPMVRQ